MTLSAAVTGQTVVLSGWLCNWDQSPHDQARIILEFLNASGGVISRISREQRNPVWTLHSITAVVPSGAVKARVKLESARFVGNDNDGYFDDLSLTISNSKFSAVYISGPTSKAAQGDTIQLTVQNGTLNNPSTTVSGIHFSKPFPFKPPQQFDPVPALSKNPWFFDSLSLSLTALPSGSM